jgi:hypothetical protein
VSDPDSDCTTAPRTTTANSSALVLKLASSTASVIHNAAHDPVTSVAVGATVHDFVTVMGQPGSPNPTGNVNVDWFLNGDCSGGAAANSGSVALDASGQSDVVGFAFTVNSAGFRAFRAHYEGDARYLGSDGACEPLVVGTPTPDTTKPTCVLKDAFSGPPHGIHVSAQDTGSGLKSITVKSSSNATTAIPPFSVGTTAEVVVTASRTNDAVSANVTLSVKDVAGNETICDPVLTSTVRSSSGQPAGQTFSGLLQAESKVTIVNGDPGMTKVTIEANGVKFRELSLEPGQVVHVDVASAMNAGSDNTITITARGKKGASADVIIADR